MSSVPAFSTDTFQTPSDAFLIIIPIHSLTFAPRAPCCGCVCDEMESLSRSRSASLTPLLCRCFWSDSKSPTLTSCRALRCSATLTAFLFPIMKVWNMFRALLGSMLSTEVPGASFCSSSTKSSKRFFTLSRTPWTACFGTGFRTSTSRPPVISSVRSIDLTASAGHASLIPSSFAMPSNSPTP